MLLFFVIKYSSELGMVEHMPSTWKAEASRSLSSRPKQAPDSQGNTEKPSLKNKQTNNNNIPPVWNTQYLLCYRWPAMHWGFGTSPPACVNCNKPDIKSTDVTCPQSYMRSKEVGFHRSREWNSGQHGLRGQRMWAALAQQEETCLRFYIIHCCLRSRPW